MTNHCGYCGRVLTGWQKNRKYCNTDHYMRKRYGKEYEIKRLKAALNEERACTRQMNRDWQILWQKTQSKTWLLKRLLGLV